MSYDMDTTVFTGDKGELPPSLKRPSGMTRQAWRAKQRAEIPQPKLCRNGQPRSVPPTIKLVQCPDCEKDRLGKYLGEDGKPLPTSFETIEVREEKRYLDVCGVCANRYRTADTKFVMDNFKKIQQALRSRKAGTTDKDFTIDL